ncbi:MAG TPA: tetratricopeptide repeat protein [Terriglobales bacterium]|nr:tetratricopeptide repeat protein [Terriglobales bacterium]
MLRAAVPLLLFSSLTLGVSAQSGGERGTFATNPPGAPGLASAGTTARSFVLSGKVVVDDGSLLTDSVVIQSNCKGRIRTQARTDSKGFFSIETDSQKQRRDDPEIDFSQRGRRQDPLAVTSAQTGLASDLLNSWSDCQLQAVLPGFSSQPVELARYSRDSGFSDVGTIVLRRLAQVQGFTISVTSARAPTKARKEYEKGRELEQQEKWDSALMSFRKAVEVYPEYAIAWFEIGRVQARQGDLVPARQSFHQSLAADSTFISPYLELAQLALRDRRWQEVVDSTDALLKLNPIDFPQDWFLNAAGNFYLQRLDAAETSARRGLELDGQHRVPKLEYLMGTILAQKHDYAGAIAHLRNYLHLAPHATDAETAQKQAEELERLPSPAGEHEIQKRQAQP